MNKEQLIQDFQKAQEQHITHGKGKYWDRYTNAYCAAGWMAKSVGLNIEEIDRLQKGSEYMSDRFYSLANKRYNLETNDYLFISNLIDANDLLFHSWDDVIKFVEKYGEEDWGDD